MKRLEITWQEWNPVRIEPETIVIPRSIKAIDFKQSITITASQRMAVNDELPSVRITSAGCTLGDLRCEWKDNALQLSGTLRLNRSWIQRDHQLSIVSVVDDETFSSTIPIEFENDPRVIRASPSSWSQFGELGDEKLEKRFRVVWPEGLDGKISGTEFVSRGQAESVSVKASLIENTSNERLRKILVTFEGPKSSGMLIIEFSASDGPSRSVPIQCFFPETQ